MIGNTISHYRILEQIGAGGMGIVYKAEDTKLRRTVALKFLPPELNRDEEAKKRFVREAQAAAALDHPNICTVYEVNEFDGQIYIAMAYIEGESLKQSLERGPRELGRALGIAAQAAEGLRAAHARGIIHRDIKSANLMVTPEGQVKIMDFGLAKTAEMTRMTKTGTTLGTAAYMSPEQALGQPTDHRTDIWSLGVVLYEMLTGQLPFKGDYDPALMYSIANEDPEPVTAIKPDVPLEVERVVGRALTKKPDRRYQSAEELITDLKELRESLDLLPRRSQWQLTLIRQRRRIAIAAAAAVVVAVLVILGIRYFKGSAQAFDSIAVLPVEYSSGDPDQGYKVNGMTIELTAALQQVGAWTVKSSRSMMRYKGSDKSLSDIAAEIDAKALLSPSITSLSGDRIEVIVELVAGATEEILWTQPFECASSEINKLYNDIAWTICERAGIELTPSENAQLASASPVIPEAHELHLKAMHEYSKWTFEGVEKAIEHYQQAIEIDPDYALAYALLADCYHWLGFYHRMPIQEARSKATPLIRRALEIDEECSEAHFALGQLRFWFDWDWLGAEEEYKRAIELNPNNAWAHGEYAWNLMVMGRFEEAIAGAKLMLHYDPVSYPANMSWLYIHYCARQYDQAVAHHKQYAELEPDDPRIYTDLAMVYRQMGRYDDAIRARQKAMTLSKDTPDKIAAKIAALDSAYSESGPEGYWMWSLEEWKRSKGFEKYPGVTAAYYAQLGDKDQALTWLEEAYEMHDGKMPRLKVDPCWDPLRDDPRFQEILRRMNFPENGPH